MNSKPISNKVVMEGYLDMLEKQRLAEAAKEEEGKIAERQSIRESECLIQKMNTKTINTNRLNSFVNSVTNALLAECVYHTYYKAMRPELRSQPNVTGMMRAMVGEFINEDAHDIISRMRTKSATTSDMYNLIQSTRKKILESEAFEKTDPSTYCIGKDVKSEFFDKLETMDDESISAAIRERVSQAVDDFIAANKRDHDEITSIIQQSNDKIAEMKNKPEPVKEAYERQYKAKVNKIRNRKKTIFEGMVMAMSESVMKDPQLKEEFSEGSKLNVPKIVDRIETMYTFIETVNTMGLYPIDETYMKDLIESLRKGE